MTSTPTGSLTSSWPSVITTTRLHPANWSISESATVITRCRPRTLLSSHFLVPQDGVYQLATWERGAPSVFTRKLFRYDGNQLVQIRSQDFPVSPKTYKDRYVPEPKKP
jgi:hypothetical protein